MDLMSTLLRARGALCLVAYRSAPSGMVAGWVVTVDRGFLNAVGCVMHFSSRASVRFRVPCVCFVLCVSCLWAGLWLAQIAFVRDEERPLAKYARVVPDA